MRLALAIVAIALLSLASAAGEQVPVRFTEGVVHGFLALSTLDGTLLAAGDLIQNARGNQVTTRLTFHFKDGSLYDEKAVYSQRQRFRLLSDHLVQKGPAFPQPLEMSIDATNGRIVVHYTSERGEAKVETEHIDVPADLANGMVLTLLKNVRPETPPKTVSFIAATPRPRLVKLALSTATQEAFSFAGSSHEATHYVLKVDIGGIQGLLAPLLGKQPPDSHVWILRDETPAFVKAEQTFYLGGPLWRIELASPMWRSSSPAATPAATSK